MKILKSVNNLLRKILPQADIKKNIDFIILFFFCVNIILNKMFNEFYI